MILRKRSELGAYRRLHELKLDDARFHQYFRMTPSKFEELLAMVGPHIQRMNTPYRRSIEPGERLTIITALSKKGLIPTVHSKIQLVVASWHDTVLG